MQQPEEIKPVNNIERIIKSYLQIETGYALLINGRRGIGKTFFIKNKILPQISLTKGFHNQRKAYKPIYISLYGLNSIDEVYTLFAFELLPFLKGETIKITMSVVKMLMRGLLNYQRAGNIDDLLKDAISTSKGAIDTKDFVIIFDDLDRLSSKITIDEFIGFVNSLVEHDNNKVIIITDQNEIPNKDNYNAVKEKTIGTIIEFTSSFEETFEEIIAEKYKKKGFGSFYRYLDLLKPVIIDLFSVTDTVNLRTLIYFLQHFVKIFSAMYDCLNLCNEEPGELNLFKLNTITRFALSVCIEFKNGNITYTNPNDIDKVDEINAILNGEWLKEAYSNNARSQNEFIPESKEELAKKSYKEQFVKRYYKKKTYHFYRSIFNFVTGGNDFDSNLLLIELKTNIDDNRRQVFRQDELINLLSYPQVYDLSNKEYIKLTKELFEFALNGQFSLDRYLTVFHFMVRFPGILKNDPFEVTNKLIAAIHNHANNFQFIPSLENHFSASKDQTNHDYSIKLFQELNIINNRIKKTEQEQSYLALFDIFKVNPSLFYEKIFNQYNECPIFESWNFIVFYKQVKLMPTNELRALNTFLKSRYSMYEVPKWVEIDFLTKLRDKVADEVKGKETLRKYVLEGTLVILSSLLEKTIDLQSF